MHFTFKLAFNCGSIAYLITAAAVAAAAKKGISMPRFYAKSVLKSDPESRAETD
jgi:hypothetical protein